MYFKSLELIGFKSFADKTLLNFEPGVTAIVGPNGCGKSNIADSIRWVLGEQSSKSLRASNMQDVIFNGTDSKDPINFAEVSLTLSNEKRLLPIDYDEVIITRRVFRSGETEYLLNKTPVRLKDISELLMGTGIGTESYSIIEQGKMDLVLSSKPEDRRFVFEEASGITKYKAKKKEALRKLEQTEQNLLRINDIIQEVKRQIGSIERQARKAERYKVDFEKLKELETKLSVFEYRELRTTEKTYTVESGDIKERESAANAEVATIAAAIAAYRQRLDEINQNVLEVQNRRTGIAGSLEMNRHKIEVDKERIEEARLSREALAQEIAGIKTRIAAAEGVIADLRQALERLSSEKAAKLALLQEKESASGALTGEIEQLAVTMQSCKVSALDYLTRETRIKNELIKIGADIQNRKARERRLILEKETVEKDLTGASLVAEEVAREVADSASAAAAAKAELDAKRSANDAALAGIRSIEGEIAAHENRKTSIRSKIEVLEDVMKRYEGFALGVKSLLVCGEAGGPFPGIVNVLANIIRVERGYEEAVHTFLGPNAQVVIAERESDITASIAYLKEKGLGRASLISLETAGRTARAVSSQPSGTMHPLRARVGADPAYGHILDRFFAKAALADAIDDTVKADALAGGFTVVTPSGLTFDDGVTSGGSAAESDESHLIGRREKLEGLVETLAATEGEQQALEAARVAKVDAARTLGAEIAALEEQLRSFDISVANIQAKKAAQEGAVAKLNEELSVVALELDEVHAAIDDLTQKGVVLNTELNGIETSKADLQQSIDRSQAGLADKRSLKETLALEITTIRTESQSFDREEENVRNNLGKEEVFLADSRTALAQKEGASGDLVAKGAALEGEIASLTAQNETIAADVTRLDGEIAGIEQSKSEMTDKLSIDELQLRDKEREVESLRNQIRDLDVKLTEVAYKKTNLRDRMQGAYKIDLDTLHVEIEESIDWDSFKTQTAELKDRLEKLGPVNLVAIEEHKELEERYAFLIHQQEDLVNAKESLLKAIQKINKTTKDLFIEAFQKIQIEFKSFFRLLFGGGQAELVLLDEQDVLESGIEIIVRPPGKKLQNIMLLSGGEKAMTAIALLLSIFKVRPSPFCVLDEIDAPLDESNVVRFTGVLKDFLKISQFIIITHNKRTIELADIMYGITMQERGVSKIVSVKFLDTKKEEKPVSQTQPQADVQQAQAAPA